MREVSDAEQKVEQFYTTRGWEIHDGHSEDANRWEDLRPSSAEYVSRCRLRLLPFVQGSRYILDMASGPIQYDEYLEYSKGFEKRYCVDLSSQALEAAERRIGTHGVFLQGSFFDMSFEENFFDTSISLHTIYHMAADEQEEAVLKLLRITSGPVIILYSNPDYLLSRIKKALRGSKNVSDDIYFDPHPLQWWNRFKNVATVEIYPWRSLEVKAMRKVIPPGRLGKAILNVVFSLERRFPHFFAKHGRYPMIVMHKR